MNNSPRQFCNFSCLAYERETQKHKIQNLLSMLLDPARAHTTAAELELWTEGLLGRGVYRNSQQKMICKGRVFDRVWYVWATFYEWLLLLSPDCVKYSTYITEVTVQWPWKHKTGEEVPQDWRAGVLNTPNDCRGNAKILVGLLQGYQQHFRFLNEGWCDHMKIHFEKMTGTLSRKIPRWWYELI